MFKKYTLALALSLSFTNVSANIDNTLSIMKNISEIGETVNLVYKATVILKVYNAGTTTLNLSRGQLLKINEDYAIAYEKYNKLTTDLKNKLTLDSKIDNAEQAEILDNVSYLNRLLRGMYVFKMQLIKSTIDIIHARSNVNVLIEEHNITLADLALNVLDMYKN